MLVLKFVNAGVYYTGVRIRGLTRAVKPYGGGESQRQTATFEVEILDSGRGPCMCAPNSAQDQLRLLQI